MSNEKILPGYLNFFKVKINLKVVASLFFFLVICCLFLVTVQFLFGTCIKRLPLKSLTFLY